MVNFGSRLRQLRTEKGLTQEELGKVFNMKKSRISQYETNKRQADDETKKQLADFFNVSLDFLLGHSNIRNYEQPSTPDQELAALLNDPALRVAFQDYASWTDEDKKELINYLKVKKIARENKDE